MIAEFWVPGVPVPKGSMRAFTYKRSAAKGGGVGARVDHDNARTRPWLAAVTLLARRSMQGAPPVDNAVAVRLRFVLPRPKGHSGARGLKASAPQHPAVKPDLDKLVRCVLDAMNGVTWIDDGRVVEVVATKAYGAEPGVQVAVEVAP